MFLLTMILACGSKSIETEKVSTSDETTTTEEAAAIENAVQKAINEGYRCADIARDGDNVISTKEMGALISSLLK